jgi:hypothetical protein
VATTGVLFKKAFQQTRWEAREERETRKARPHTSEQRTSLPNKRSNPLTTENKSEEQVQPSTPGHSKEDQDRSNNPKSSQPRTKKTVQIPTMKAKESSPQILDKSPKNTEENIKHLEQGMNEVKTALKIGEERQSKKSHQDEVWRKNLTEEIAELRQLILSLIGTNEKLKQAQNKGARKNR